MEQLSVFDNKLDTKEMKNKYLDELSKNVSERFSNQGLYYQCNYKTDIESIFNGYPTTNSAIKEVTSEIESELKSKYGSYIKFNKGNREMMFFVRGFIMHLCSELVITRPL